MNQLFKYVKEKNIIIKLFSQTLTHSGPTNYWKYFEINSSDSRDLKKAINNTRKLKDLGLIIKNDTLIDGKTIVLEDNVSLECLAPCTDDIEEYQKIVKLDADKNIKEASKAANLLSTVIKLKYDDNFILFTSDAESNALDRIVTNYSKNFKGVKYHVCQLPHHGSEKNQNDGFWKIVETIDKKHAIISAGKNRKYNHPSYSVIEIFHQDSYDIHCTNIVNGMSEFTKYLKLAKKASLKFDGCSSLAEEYLKSNDRTFTIQNGVFNLLK